MRIEYSWTPDVPGMRRSVRAQLRPRLRRYPVLAVTYVVLGVILFALAAAGGGDGLLTAVGCVLLAFAVLYALWPRVLVRRLADRQMKLLGLPTTVTITDDEVVWATAAFRTAWSWQAFTSVLTVPGAWLLRVNGVDAMVLDHERLAPEQLAEVRMFLATRGLVPATYRVA